MPRVSYVNGRYLRHSDAAIHIEDRGFQFSDGVYEVIAVARGELIDLDGHMARLDYSLGELRITPPVGHAPLKIIMRETMRRNGVTDGMVYFQITRGSAPRNHAFPASAMSSLVVSARSVPPPVIEEAGQGVSVITVPDIRWKRRDIKTVSLLGNVLGKQEAVEAGAAEAWMVDDDGFITEGTSSNAWIINDQKQILTRPLSASILEGITRQTLVKLAKDLDLELVERAFTVEEAYRAKEAFLTSTTSFVKPVTRINDHSVGNGEAGSITISLLESYLAFMASTE